LRPGLMGPCVRRDDPLRELKSVICDSPAVDTMDREVGEPKRGRAEFGFQFASP
jgi:hypothetical protein